LGRGEGQGGIRKEMERRGTCWLLTYVHTHWETHGHVNKQTRTHDIW
jgi:hypothetical protein